MVEWRFLPVDAPVGTVSVELRRSSQPSAVLAVLASAQPANGTLVWDLTSRRFEPGMDFFVRVSDGITHAQSAEFQISGPLCLFAPCFVPHASCA